MLSMANSREEENRAWFDSLLPRLEWTTANNLPCTGFIGGMVVVGWWACTPFACAKVRGRADGSFTETVTRLPERKSPHLRIRGPDVWNVDNKSAEKRKMSSISLLLPPTSVLIHTRTHTCTRIHTHTHAHMHTHQSRSCSRFQHATIIMVDEAPGLAGRYNKMATSGLTREFSLLASMITSIIYRSGVSASSW